VKSLPFSFIIGAVKWDVFCTLTYKEACASIETAALHGQQWLEKLRLQARLQVQEFYWFLRPERGESNGRIHLHALLRVRPKQKGYLLVAKGRLSMGHRLWGRGMTTFRAVVDNNDPAILYLQKDKTCGADSYETVKTAACSHGIPSTALLRRASLQQSDGETQRWQTMPGKHTGGKFLPLASG